MRPKDANGWECAAQSALHNVRERRSSMLGAVKSILDLPFWRSTTSSQVGVMLAMPYGIKKEGSKRIKFCFQSRKPAKERCTNFAEQRANLRRKTRTRVRPRFEVKRKFRGHLHRYTQICLRSALARRTELLFLSRSPRSSSL